MEGDMGLIETAIGIALVLAVLAGLALQAGWEDQNYPHGKGLE
jgi:hypothetical protein